MLHVLRVEMVINSPWLLSKNWLVQKQTVFGKYSLNPFMADNLPKIVWFSTHHITCMKSWLVQKKTALGQTTTGIESSNPFMAGSLPKTILYSFLHKICFHFWNTAMVKRSGDVTRLQALVNKKKIVISEDVIREILRLDDAEGVFLIHTILQSLSAKRTSWNEFSTAMDSAVICLSKGQRFNFLRVEKGCSGVETPLFENMLEVREVDAEEEVQVPAQDDVDQENVTEEIADDVAQPTSPLPPSPVIPSSPPHQSPRSPPPQATEGLESANTAQQLEILKLKARVKKLERLNNVFNQGRISVDIDEGIELVDDQEKDAQVKGRQADTQAEIYNIDLDHTSKVLSMQED
nr:hypothetical protein [Tanacetum cinerariifolium]